MKRQQGMTAIGVLLLLAMLAFFFYLGIKVYPMYYDSFKVNAALDSLKTEPGISTKSSQEITSLLKKRLEIDNVDGIEASDILVQKAGATVTVSVDYEVETGFIGNLSLVAHFEKEVEAGN